MSHLLLMSSHPGEGDQINCGKYLIHCSNCLNRSCFLLVNLVSVYQVLTMIKVLDYTVYMQSLFNNSISPIRSNGYSHFRDEKLE